MGDASSRGYDDVRRTISGISGTADSRITITSNVSSGAGGNKARGGASA